MRPKDTFSLEVLGYMLYINWLLKAHCVKAIKKIEMVCSKKFTMLYCRCLAHNQLLRSRAMDYFFLLKLKIGRKKFEIISGGDKM